MKGLVVKSLIQVHVHGSGVIQDISRITSYCYLGIKFAIIGSWDSHVQKGIV